MNEDEELELINTIMNSEKRGVSATKKKLVDMSDMNWVFRFGYVMVGLGLLIILSVSIMFPKEIEEILEEEKNATSGKVFGVLIVLFIILFVVKLMRQNKAVERVISGEDPRFNWGDFDGCSVQYARGLIELDRKIQLESLYNYDEDMFNIFLFGDICLHQRDLLKLTKKNHLFRMNYRELSSNKNDIIEFQKSCDYVKPKALKVLNKTCINAKKNLRRGF